MTTSIPVSRELLIKLNKIKYENDFKTLDETLRWIIKSVKKKGQSNAHREIKGGDNNQSKS